MRFMFQSAWIFNQNIGGWETSSVTTMDSMFRHAVDFNQNIGGWDTSQVESMYHMFDNAVDFNQNIGGWNTSQVGDMRSMFSAATSFNQDLSGWDVCNVTVYGSFDSGAGFDGQTAKHPNFGDSPPDCAGGDREIDVQDGGGTSIASGGTLSLGKVGSPGVASTLVLTIRNTGADSLSLGNVSASSLSNVSIQSAVLGASSVASGGSTTLTIGYTPTAAGAISFVLTIANNDADEGSYVITVEATAGSDQAQAQPQILAAASQIIGGFFADSIQANASNRLRQAKGGNGRVFQNNLAQFGQMSWDANTPGDAVILSSDVSSATTDPGEALELIGQRLGFVGSDGRISVTTDDLALAAIELSQFQSAAQVAQLDPALTASFTAGPDRSGSALAGLLPGDGLDVYAAYTGGHLFKTGVESYDGFASDLMLGVDGFVTDGLFLGLALGHEASVLDLSGALTAHTLKQGWRGDAYAAWQVFESFNLEGLVSYGGFENKLVYLGETGRPDSQRWITSGKASLDWDWDGYTLSPYGAINYSHESFDAYTSDAGTSVAKFGVEQGQWDAGIRVQGHEAAVFGLTGYARAAASGTWLNRDTVAGAPLLDVLDENQITASWELGLDGKLQGFGQGTWLGAVLESADAHLRYGESGLFGANRVTSWSVGLSWQY